MSIPETSPVPILFLDHTAQMGGGEIALLNLVRALDGGRYRPLVALASDGPLAELLRASGVETHVRRLDAAVVNTRKDCLGLRSLLQIRQAMACFLYAVRLAVWARRRGVRLIHANSLKADLYGGLAGRLCGIPVLWHVRDSINRTYLPPTVAALFRRLARCVPRAIIANSESTLRTLSLRGQFSSVVYSGVARVVHDGCDNGRFWASVPKNTEDRGPVIALVGRIAAWKGQHVFLRAAARVLAQRPRVCFWIIGAPLFGEAEYERSLHQLACTLGIADHVTFWGFREDVPALLAQTDILVHASILGEPFGQVVIEGMAAGKPVIATEGGALPEIVVPGKTGLLVPMGEDRSMADAVLELLADPARARAMGAAGRQRVEEMFTIAQTARRVTAIYDQILAPGTGARRRHGHDLLRA